MGSLLVVVMVSRNRRRKANDEHLRQKNGVNAGGAYENETRSMRGPRGARRYQERDGVLENGEEG
jgi:hypothetical protein